MVVGACRAEQFRVLRVAEAEGLARRERDCDSVGNGLGDVGIPRRGVDVGRSGADYGS